MPTQMRAVIYNLDGEFKEDFDGIYQNAQFIYYTLEGILAGIPVLKNYAERKEHTFPCDYTRSYPGSGPSRVAYYKYNGKEYEQLTLQHVTVRSTPLTLIDYITQWKLGQKTIDTMIKEPNIWDIAKTFTYIAAFILLIGVGYVVGQFNGSINNWQKTNNQTLIAVQHVQQLQQNQTSQLFKLFTALCNKYTCLNSTGVNPGH